MDALNRMHLERLRMQTIEKHTMESIPEWICNNTQILGEPFSFKDHEFQERILRDTSPEKVVIKCSQVGLTEASTRLALAMCSVNNNFTVIYTLPTITFASSLMTTRVDPVIEGSPFLSDAVSKSINNSEIKKIGDSFLYFKGAASGNAPISIPADMLIHDEYDFSDQKILEQYQSRLTHSKYKMKTIFSTPTIPGFGVDAEFQLSRRHHNMCKCNHCNHWFLPDYYDHVRIPGYDGRLQDISKHNLHTIRWREAYLACPKCGETPSLQLEHREWVVENKDDQFVRAGYRVSPFDAPNVITPAYLVQTSTKYDRISQFQNYNLGMAAEDSETSLMREELMRVLIDPQERLSGRFVLGIDVGITSHFVVMEILADGRRVIVHTEQVPVQALVERKNQICAKYRVRLTVIDALPYTETVLKMQDKDPNLYAAFYGEKKVAELLHVVQREENIEKGKLDIRQVNINRSKAFDALMAEIRSGMILKMRDENDETWVKQLTDMKRMQKFQDQELAYVWVKSSEGNDHFHHATLYAESAATLVGMSSNRGGVIPMLSTFRMRSKVKSRGQKI